MKSQYGAKITGILRGILKSGLIVSDQFKLADVDARCEESHCYSISDKSLAVGGGVLELLLHGSMKGIKMETIYDVMKDRLQLTETTLMVTVLSGPRQGDKTIYAEDGSILYGTPIEGFMVDKAKLNSLCMVGEVECFVQPVENDPSVLVLGAGHVSRAITDLLLFIGCRVTVVDDRPEYVVPEFFDERVTRKCLPLENF